MNVIGVKDSTDNMTLNIGANYIVKNGDRFLVIGKTVELERFDYFIKQKKWIINIYQKVWKF